MREHLLKLLSGAEVDNLVFGQQHPGSKEFFTRRCGCYHTVPINEMPHYQFLVNHLHRNPFASHVYEQYLKCSWDFLYGVSQNTEQRRLKQIQKFISLYEEIKSIGKIDQPIVTCMRPDSRRIIVDGNHRASAALALRLEVPAVELSTREYLGRICQIQEEFYGSGYRQIPYQSVVNDKQTIIPGRRPDLLERIEMIDRTDLKDQAILDLGCNLGMSCFLAADYGARETLGLDISPRLITAALRLNAYYALPCDFSVHDLNHYYDAGKQYDTVFCFSLTSHLFNMRALVETVVANTAKVLYFEGHSGTRLKDYEFLLNKRYFSSLELKGYSRDSYRSVQRSRPFFRCSRH